MRTIIKKKRKGILIYYNSAILNVSKYIYIFPNYVLNRQECLYNAPRNPDLLIKIRISFYKIIGYKIF